MQKLINWCKQQWILLATCFLIAFVPLYPKLPLFDIVQTWVYVRIEDVLVAMIGATFVLMLWRKKLFPATSLTIPIIVYWVVTLVSVVFSILFIGPKLLGYFPHLALLHYFRRIEYMGVFFLGYYALAKKPAHLTPIIWTLAVTALGIIIYGVGQKFLGFPAFLTMNEEFAKGVPLRLPPTARIAATFGGHYDLGAYLVMVIPIFGSLAFGMQKFWQKISMLVLAIGSLVLLLFTASRISFLVYLVAISTMLIWKKKPLLILPVILVSFILLNAVSSASERFYKTFRFSDVIVDLSTGQPIGTLDQLEGSTAKVETQESPATENLPKGSGFIGVATQPTKPARSIKTIEYITSSTLATGSGEIATISGSFLIQKAFVYDISLTTRFQGEWPKAIEAFKRNMVLGSGFSTLSVATDGDYLRMLGETGIVGTIAFLGIFLMAFTIFLRGRSKLDPLGESFVVGVFAGIIGIFLNAILIDVFEASKVAFSLWLLIGSAMAVLAQAKITPDSYLKVLYRAFSSRLSYLFYLGVAVCVVYAKGISFYFMGDDFTWLRWAASTPSSALGSYMTQSAGFFYRPLAKLLYFLIYSVFWLKPQAYHIVSLVMFFWISALLFVLQCRRGIRVWIALLMTLVFITLSVHHEVVLWISTYSHLLCAGFLLSALLMFDAAWQQSNKHRALWWSLGLLFTFASALSYEGGAVAGLIVAYLGFFLYEVRSWSLLGILATMPVYWWMRTMAGSVAAEGNYGMRPSTLLVNSVANAIGYMVATIAGPKSVEWFEAIRANMRQHVLWMSLLALGLGITSVIKIRIMWVKASPYRKSLIWLGAAIVSMIPFLGLGGITERYALVPSIFVVIALGVMLETLWQKVHSFQIKALVIVLTIGCIAWNVAELGRVTSDWQKASHISETTILALKANYFPLQDKQAFVFVNTPIRYGRAWIFPTGLTDAMWHMFKFNGHPFAVYTAPSRADAFKVTSPLGVPIVLEFNDFVLNVVKREVKTVEVEDAAL